MEKFDSILSSVIDSTLGQRCNSIIGYQYSEIIRSLMSVYFCRCLCIEDVNTHLMHHLSLHPRLRTCSVDTILRSLNRIIGRVERGSFTLTLSQNRAWKSPLTRLFTLNSLCTNITLGSDLSANDRIDCGLCSLSLAANRKPWQWACDGNACISCVPNRQAPCSGGS